jgi:cytochrome c2
MNPNSDEDIAIDGDIVQGSRVYTQNCLCIRFFNAACHTLAPSTAALNTSGPALGLIYQRRAASDINFNGYSKPLLDADIYWSGRNLFKYLESPSTFIKGSKCMFVTGGLKSEEDRVDVIKFLKQYSKEMAKNMRIKSEDLHGKDYVKMQLVAQR